MGNCAASPCGEVNEPYSIKESNNKRSFKSFFQNENEKAASKTFSFKRKEAPIKLNQDKIKLETIMREINKTKSSNSMLDACGSYEKNITDVFTNRKILSTQISNKIKDADPYTRNDTMFKAYNGNNNNNNQKNKNSNDLFKTKSSDLNNKKDKNAILIKDELSEDDHYDYEDFEISKRPASSIFMKKKNLIKRNSDDSKNLNYDKFSEEVKEKKEEPLEENKIVEEIRQNKMFYKSDGLKSFRKKTPKRNTDNNQKEEEKKYSLNPNFKLDDDSQFDFNTNLKTDKLKFNAKNTNQRYNNLNNYLLDSQNINNFKTKIPVNNGNALEKQQFNENKNILRKNKSSNLTIITNPKINEKINIKNIEKFNKDLNSELIKNKDKKAKEVMCDTIENIENILISCNNESIDVDEADKSLLNIDLIKSTTTKNKKSEALIKISKKPPSALTSQNISISSNTNKNTNKIIYNNNTQAAKITDKNYFYNSSLLNKTETEKKLEKKISLLLSANTNNYINRKLNKINLKPQHSNGNNESGSDKATQISYGNYTNRLNLNNPKIVKNSFDLSIPNNSSTYSTKSKTNSNKFSKSINSTPVNRFKGANGNEKKCSSIYSIDPKIFQDKNILEFISDFQPNKR